jgi:MFS family permease
MTTAAVDEAEPPARAPTQATSGSGYTNAAILVIVGFITTTLAQTGVLAGLPLNNLIKNELHASRSTLAAFLFLSGLPWYFKPFAGILTDAFPIFGSRRRSYLLISTLLSVAAWIGLIFTPLHYDPILWVCIAINLFMVVASTVLGGFMVEVAQATGGSGRLSSLRNMTSAAVTLITSPVAGFLASIAFSWTAVACGAVMFVLFPATYFLLKEERQRVDSKQVLTNVGVQFNNIVSARTLWAAAALTLLVFIAPGFSTALFYRQQNELGMMPNIGPGGWFGSQAFLGLIAGTFGLMAPFVYIWACRRLNLRWMLAIALAASTSTTLSYLFYSSVTNARIIAGLDSFAGSLAEVALMDLAVRATPKGSEGLGFSLMVSVRNLAIFGTNWMGSAILDKYNLPFNDLVVANAATTAICVPLVWLLPAVLVRRKDAEVPEPPALETQIQE